MPFYERKKNIVSLGLTFCMYQHPPLQNMFSFSHAMPSIFMICFFQNAYTYIYPEKPDFAWLLLAFAFSPKTNNSAATLHLIISKIWKSWFLLKLLDLRLSWSGNGRNARLQSVFCLQNSDIILPIHNWNIFIII